MASQRKWNAWETCTISAISGAFNFLSVSKLVSIYLQPRRSNGLQLFALNCCALYSNVRLFLFGCLRGMLAWKCVSMLYYFIRTACCARRFARTCIEPNVPRCRICVRGIHAYSIWRVSLTHCPKMALHDSHVCHFTNVNIRSTSDKRITPVLYFLSVIECKYSPR